jgi:hypothetical protein
LVLFLLLFFLLTILSPVGPQELEQLREERRNAAYARRSAEQSLAELFARQKATPAPVDRDASYPALVQTMTDLEEDHLFALAGFAKKAHTLRAVLERDNVCVLCLAWVYIFLTFFGVAVAQ